MTKEDKMKRLSFDDLVRNGIYNGANVINGMPWSWKINGKSVTHENDECYIVETINGNEHFHKGDYLVIGGEHLYILKGNTLSEHIKCRRLILGLTLRDVEKQTGISNAYLSQLENGRIKKPSYKTVQTLYNYFGIMDEENMNELTTLISTMSDPEREQLILMAKFILINRK